MTQAERAFGNGWVIIPVAFVVGGVWFWLGVRRGRPIREVAAQALLVASVLCFGALTLVPVAGNPSHVVEWVPFTGLDSAARRTQVIGNTLVLIPTGFLSRFAFPDVRLVRWFGLPLGVELLQWALPIGRVAAVEDVLLGIAGLALGAAPAAVLAAALASHPRVRQVR